MNIRSRPRDGAVFLRPRSLIAFAVAGSLVAPQALAYVGPGAGLTMLGALWALLVAIVVAVGFVILWPLRRMLRRRRDAVRTGAGADGAPDAGLEDAEHGPGTGHAAAAKRP